MKIVSDFREPRLDFALTEHEKYGKLIVSFEGQFVSQFALARNQSHRKYVAVAVAVVSAVDIY